MHHGKQILMICEFPLLVQVWSYKHFTIGRPSIEDGSYGSELYEVDKVDGPTVGAI